jgi:hypothetical protein
MIEVEPAMRKLEPRWLRFLIVPYALRQGLGENMFLNMTI